MFAQQGMPMPLLSCARHNPDMQKPGAGLAGRPVLRLPNNPRPQVNKEGFLAPGVSQFSFFLAG